METLQTHSRFLLEQRITLLVNRYEYFLYAQDTKGPRIAFAEQKRFAFREHVTVWQNEDKSTPLFTIEAEKLLDVHGKFLIKDAGGEVVGYCRKLFGASLLRSTWEVHDAHDALLFIAHEKSQNMALIRRIAEFVPFLTEVAGFFPFNFVFENNKKEVGSHVRFWGSLNDRYILQLSEELAACDRRLPLALGILLDALQDR